MLNRLTVRGFKSIRALDDFRMGPLNVLIGANGAGKSNFVDLFALAGALARENLELTVARQGGPDAVLFGGRERTARMEAEFDFGERAYEVALEPEGGRLIVARERLVERTGRAPEVRDLGGGAIEARLAAVEPGFPAAVMREFQTYHFCDTGRTAAVRGEQALRNDRRLRPDGGNLAPYLRRLGESHPVDYEEIVRAVRSVAPFFSRFVARSRSGERMELEWVEKGEPEIVRGPGEMSDGTLRFACLMTLLLQPTEMQPRTILMDEPELGMHPYGLGILSEVIREVSRRRQIVVATQSADLAGSAAPEEVVVVTRSGAESLFERPDPERLKGWLRDFPMGALWKMNVLGGRPTEWRPL